MKYILYRILGNDLPPRHLKGQTLDNLKFILEYEGDFVDCEKRFVLNRIVDFDTQSVICDLLMKAGYKFSIIPFILEQYRELESVNERIQYLTNVNRARNYCIEQGIEEAEYVLPFDGGSMFREDGWQSFDANVRFNSGDPYFVVGQWRPKSYDDFLNVDQPELKEEYKFGKSVVTGIREPTVVFGQGHDKRFNEDLMYGNADKVELVAQLGIAGVWMNWISKDALKNMSKFAGTVKMISWVARLPSGNDVADFDNQIRGKMRAEGIQRLLEKANGLNYT